MNDREQGPKDIDTGERMATLAAAKADAIIHKLRGEHETEEGTRYSADPAEVETLIDSRPNAPKMVARKLLEQYGAPNEATPTKLFWYHNGPWKRTVLTRDVVTHNFPTAHSDFLTQFIDYQVPPDKFDEIARFDGSCLADPTAGKAAARCDSEAMKILTLNLLHEIVTGTMRVEEARETYAENAAAYTMGRAAPYVGRFQFEVPHGGTADPDDSMIAGAMVRQTLGKVKDLLTGSGERSSSG